VSTKDAMSSNLFGQIDRVLDECDARRLAPLQDWRSAVADMQAAIAATGITLDPETVQANAAQLAASMDTVSAITAAAPPEEEPAQGAAEVADGVLPLPAWQRRVLNRFLRRRS
jgi:hypothetical protein